MNVTSHIVRLFFIAVSYFELYDSHLLVMLFLHIISAFLISSSLMSQYDDSNLSSCGNVKLETPSLTIKLPPVVPLSVVEPLSDDTLQDTSIP